MKSSLLRLLSGASWVVTLLCGLNVYAQQGTTPKKGYARYISVIAGVGPSYYFGDLNTSFNALGSTRGQVNLAAKMRFSEHVSLRGEFTYYSIGASDSKNGNEDRRTRNLSFRARNFEAAAIGQYDLVPRASMYSRYARRPHYSPYIYMGIGVTTNTPEAQFQGTYYSLRSLQTGGRSYGGVVPVIPIGIGLKIKISPEADILIDYGYRFAFSDYLDDIGRDRYPGSATFSDPIAAALSDRRAEVDSRYKNPAFTKAQWPWRGSKSLDAYGFFSVKYQYTISKSQLKRLRKGVRSKFKSRLNRYR